MWQKAGVLIGIVFLLMTIRSAESATVPIKVTLSCSGGGTKTATGTWDPDTGAFDITATLNSCVESGNTLSGTITSTGTFVLATESLSINQTISMTATTSKGNTGTINCTTKISGGTFHRDTQEFEGSSTNTCTTTGKLSGSLAALLGSSTGFGGF